MDERPRVLVVSDDLLKAQRWTEWLGEEGFSVTTCPGTHVIGNCPRLEGNACSWREEADLAVVDVLPSPDVELYGEWPEPACTKLRDDGRTVFVHEPQVDISFGEEGVHIGSRVTKARFIPAVVEAWRKDAKPETAE
jgi:CheY-like chemotaxis protein